MRTRSDYAFTKQILLIVHSLIVFLKLEMKHYVRGLHMKIKIMFSQEPQGPCHILQSKLEAVKSCDLLLSGQLGILTLLACISSLTSTL